MNPVVKEALKDLLMDVIRQTVSYSSSTCNGDCDKNYDTHGPHDPLCSKGEMMLRCWHMLDLLGYDCYELFDERKLMLIGGVKKVLEV